MHLFATKNNNSLLQRPLRLKIARINQNQDSLMRTKGSPDDGLRFESGIEKNTVNLPNENYRQKIHFITPKMSRKRIRQESPLRHFGFILKDEDLP
jgi:hypothetical protein